MTTAIDDIDQEALERCLAIARRDPKLAEVLDGKAADGEDPFGIGVAACYRVQSQVMGLDPWQTPICFCEVGPRPDPVALGILDRMLRVGVSRYSPDPMRELAEAEARLREPVK